jgi:PAS domain S-box-containing protein
MFHFDPEYITIFISIIGGLFTFGSLLWIKFLRPVLKLVNNQDLFTESVKELRKELMTNGGNSLKDSIIELKKICKVIDKRQRIIEQRTRASMHYNEIALFETDNEGRLIWNNIHLHKFIGDSNLFLEGYDWINIVNEEDRNSVLQEFKSCIEMNRRFNKVTRTSDGRQLRLIGYPYKISDEEHGGFLVSVSET